MIEFDEMPQSLLLARGQYATVRSAHEDSKKELSILCGRMSATASQILRAMQPDSDSVPESIDSLLAVGRNTLDLIESTSIAIEQLAKQKQELKPQAWPRN